MFVESPGAFLVDFGVPASLTSAPGTWSFADTSMNWANAAFKLDGTADPILYSDLAIFDQPDSDVLGDRVISTEYQIIYRTEKFPPLTEGMEITVNGAIYEVIASKQLDDGEFSMAALEL